MIMNTWFCQLLSSACNRLLALDHDSAERLARIQGRVLQVELTPLKFIFQCQAKPEGVSVTPGTTHPADTLIKGTPWQLFNLLLVKQARQAFAEKDLEVSGNAEVGQAYLALFAELDLDWEEYLSQLTGDISAHHAGQAIRHCHELWQKSSTRLAEQVNEFIHEEALWLPAREALQDFFNDIDELRLDVDRAEAKLKLLYELAANSKI